MEFEKVAELSKRWGKARNIEVHKWKFTIFVYICIYIYIHIGVTPSWETPFFCHLSREKLPSLLGRNVLHIGSLLEVISLSSLPPAGSKSPVLAESPSGWLVHLGKTSPFFICLMFPWKITALSKMPILLVKRPPAYPSINHYWIIPWIDPVVGLSLVEVGELTPATNHLRSVGSSSLYIYIYHQFYPLISPSAHGIPIIPLKYGTSINR